ncbi:MAG TPA: phosphoenolpyruvate--protein phosphotransferase [Polyangia bacterium]|jgi:phosphotransferase system enzyme I (PtsP)
MNITTALVRIVEQAHSLARILDAAVRVIAERHHVEGGFVFLLDEQGNLVRSAASGSTSSGGSQRADAEAESIAAQVTAERRVATVRHDTSSLVGVPMLLRDSMVGALVLRDTERRDFSADDIGALATTGAQLVGIIENARVVDALDRGETHAPRPVPRPPSADSKGGERILRGIGASPGVAIGVVVFRGAYRLDLSARELPAGEPAAERARVRMAIEKAHNDLLRVQSAAAREIDEEHALIFAAHLLLLNDPMLLGRIDQAITRGASAPLAIDAALDELETRLRLVPDSYFQEKIDDLDDLRTRLLDHVLDGGGRARFGARIVLTSRMPPSLVVELKTEGAQALVTEGGGATSHGVLLARAMGLPVVTGIADLLASVRPGDRLVVDGTNGLVIVRPSEDTVARYEEDRRHAERVRTEHAKLRDVLTRTADGVRVTLHANVGVASDLTVARDNGAEGIGLYRTEFPFIVRDAFPTLREQVRIYRKAYEVFPGGPINFRILDLGGDKFGVGGGIATARNAFHGYRSIRVLFDHPQVLREQVQALALAAADRPLRILIPMVTSIEELRRVQTIIAEALAGIDEPLAQRGPAIGVMIEVPAAVELAADIAREVDFLSIGTNDLMQYTLVVDREDARMAHVSDPYHPAILRMIARVAAAARAAGKAVSVCGEIAVRPDVALALLALGVDSLSVVPTAIPELKQALARARLEPMRRAMGGILTLCDARSVAAALREAQSA